MSKKFLAVILISAVFSNTAHAAVLGTEVSGWSHKLANGADLYRNEFMSEQNNVGMQTEYYVKYTPNTAVLPSVIGGNTVWGMRNIEKAADYMQQNGLNPVIGINASFFSFETGIPMGVSVSNGRIITKDTEEYRSIGFNSDGTAFIAPLKIRTILKFGEEELEISHINKYNQETTPILNLYTPDFDDNNHNEIPSLTIILSEIDGKLAIGKTLNATVIDKFTYTGAVKIPEGQFLVTLNENSDEELFNKFSSLEVGDSVQIASYSDSDKRWENAVFAMGSVGETLIENGIINPELKDGAAPRTAAGITENGDVLFYVLDGRQAGYSYGAKTETVARRLKELGCIEAINLDGGGSTSMLGVYPGNAKLEVINSPSDKNLRKCSNYLFLHNNTFPTGVIGGIYMYPFEEYYLSGYEEKLTPKAVDTNFYPLEIPSNAEFSVTGGDGNFNAETSVLTAKGTGKITLAASYGGVATETYYHSFETPTDIIVKGDDGERITALNLKYGDSVNLSFEAWYNGKKLKARQDSFNISVSSDICSIENSRITAVSNGGEAVLTVSAGDRSYEIPVNIESEYPFVDIANHWAREQIKYVYDEGIVSGYQREAGLSFSPLKNITREEFAVIMCRMLGVSAENYAVCLKDFDDIDEISDWAKPYVFAMANKDIILGKKGSTGNTFFSPKVTLTRAEAITILSRVLNLDELGENKFADDSDIPEWASEAIYMMSKRGFVSGYEDNTIRPNSNVTRAEAAALIYNIVSKSF